VCFGVVCTAVLLPSIFAFIVKPHPVAALVSMLAFIIWVILGDWGRGISC